MALEDCTWMVSVGAALFFLNSCLLGANNLALAWGPVVGSKVISFQVAAPMCAVSAIVGVLLFGDRTAPAFGGYLNAWTELQDLPELTLYSMLWWPLVMLIWQFMALWWQVPVVPYLGFASAMAGTALVSPGWKYINWGVHITEHPMVVSGMGAVYIPWATVPVMTIVIVTFIFLVMRTFLMRGDDPFHVVLWCAPGIACATTIINAAYLLFTLSSYSGWKFNDLSPQGVVITLCVCGVLGMCGYALNMPAEIKRARLTAPKLHPIKRMNLLGLDVETLRCLKSEDVHTGLKGWCHMLYNRLYVLDTDAIIGCNEKVMRIHGNGENFYMPAEFCFAKMQLVTCCLLSAGHAAGTMQTAANGFATMLQIYKVEYVSQESPINIGLRGIAAVGMALGILLGGWRLVPVSGVQLAKMSPFRSYVVTTASTLSSIVAVGLHLGGGVSSYVNISAVVAIGWAEGLSHVNLRKVYIITWWWFGSLIPICLITAALMAQGVYPPSASPPIELSQTESAIASATQALAIMRNATVTGQVTLEGAVRQAVATYQQARDRC
ncbi:TPA: hypothetical protein ACH3X3_010239 [Trebouxia sp. C0006]